MYLWLEQIASREGIPYEEFQQNPYTVLCTTSMGGHLAWFESSGGRWFVKPVSDAVDMVDMGPGGSSRLL